MSQMNVSGLKGFNIATAQSEGFIVKVSAAQTVVLADDATEHQVIGVLNADVSAGDVASVCLRSSAGTAKVKLGGTVAVGDQVTTNASGKGIATTTAGIRS